MEIDMDIYGYYSWVNIFLYMNMSDGMRDN